MTQVSYTPSIRLLLQQALGGEPKVIDAEVHTGPYHGGSAD
jgi:hypothetical protein